MKNILFLFTFIIFTSPAVAADKGRFFLEGDGHLSIQNAHNGKKADIQYRKDGEYDPKALNQLNVIFNVPTQQLGEGLSLRLISLLDYLQDKYSPKKTVQLYSGYRSPAHNAGLRKKGRLAGKTSYHMEAMAADVIFPGTESLKVWEYVKSLNCCGIGNYGGKTLHVDAGKPRFWLANSALPKQNEDPQNRNIYLSTDKDIYQPGETMRLFFSGISNYPFGIQNTFYVVKGNSKKETFKPLMNGKEIPSCMSAAGRQDVRFLTWQIPEGMNTFRDRLEIEVEFCGQKYDNMPQKVRSNPVIIGKP